MIEATGPYGIDYKNTTRIKILNFLSDGEWYTANEIADYTGIKREDILRELGNTTRGLIKSHGIISEHIDDPNDPHQMITRYRFRLILRPCPWDNQSPVIMKTNAKSPRYSVRCSCGIGTETYAATTEAIRKWNTRHGE